MSFENFAEFEIRADESPAVRAFDRMERAYRSALSRMGADTVSLSASSGEAWKKMEKDASQAIAKKKKSLSSLGKHSNVVFQEMARYGTRAFLAMRDAATKTFSAIAKESLMLSVTFDQLLRQIETIMDDKNESKRVTEGILAIGSAQAQTLQDIAKSYYTTISAGVTNTEQALDLVNGAAMAATAALTRTEVAVNSLTVAVNVWGKEVGNVDVLNAQMFTTMKLARTTYDQLARSLGNVASIAKLAGIQSYEVFAGFTSLTKAGMDQRTAMTYLKNAITDILKPSRQSAQLFEQLGIQYGGAAFAAKGLAGIIEDIKNKTQGDPDLITRLFPNKRALQAVATLVKGGHADFLEGLEKIKAASTEHEDAYRQAALAVKHQYDVLVTSIQATATQFWNSQKQELSDILRGAVDWIAANKETIIQWGKDFVSSLRDAAHIIAGMVTSLKESITWFQKLPVIGWATQGVWKSMQRLWGDIGKDQARTLQQRGIALRAEEEERGKKLKEYVELYKKGGETAAAVDRWRATLQEKLQKDRKVDDWRTRIRKGQDAETADLGMTAAQKKNFQDDIALIEKAKKIYEGWKRLTGPMCGGGGKGPKPPPKTKETRGEPQIATSVRQFQQHLDAVEALTKQEGDAYERLDAKRAELMVKHGVNAELVTKINAWYYDQRKKLDDKEEARLDAIVAKTEKRQQAERDKMQKAAAKKIKDTLKASATLGAEEGHAKRDPSAFFGIVLASNEELGKKFGTQLKLVGKNVDMWRSEIMRAYSPDMISYAAAWWGAFTKTGVKGAQDFAGQVQNTIMTMVNTLLGAWQSMWKGIVAGQDEAKEPLLATLLDMISSMCAQWGAFLATLAVAYAAQFNWGGMAIALVASAAMFALAGITSGAAANTRGKAQTAERESNRAARGGGSVGGAFSGSRGSLGGGANNVTIYMGFTFPPTKRQAEEAAVSMGRSVIPAMKNKGYKIPADTIASGSGL